MTPVRDLTQPGASQVAFEVQRFDWTSPDRLEVVGRWFGVRGRRFIRPTLHVEVDGERRRMLAVLDHKPWAVEDGAEWVAAFAWVGEPVDLTGGELTVGPDLSVELLPPGESHPERRRPARTPRTDVLAGEVAELRGEVQRLKRDLQRARDAHVADLNRTATEQAAELERVRGERAEAERAVGQRAAELRAALDTERERVEGLELALREARDHLATAQAEAASQREQFERERESIAAEAASAAAEEAERLRAERDTLRRERVTARGERDAAIRDRDRARQERNAWLSRTRTDVTAPTAVQLPDTPGAPAEAAPEPRPPATASGRPRPTVRLPSQVDPEAAPGGDPSTLVDVRPASDPRGSSPHLPPAAIAGLVVLAVVLVLIVALAL